MISRPFRTLVRPLSLLIILVVVSAISGFSQVNTEKFRKYYTEEGFLYNLRTTFALRAGNSEYGSLHFTGRIDHNGKKFDQFIVADIEYKSTATEQITNNGFVHLRGMWNIEARTNWEFFLQREYDRFVDLNSRNLAGTTIKYRLLEKRSADSLKTFDLNVSTGFMFEEEVWASDPENIRNDLIRSTNFISFDWIIKEKLNLNGVFYYQPAYNNINDFRFASWLTIDFALVKRFYFVFQIWYKYNNRPVNDKKPFDLSIENGIRFEFP
jgi:hypothetical protein